VKKARANIYNISKAKEQCDMIPFPEKNDDIDELSSTQNLHNLIVNASKTSKKNELRVLKGYKDRYKIKMNRLQMGPIFLAKLISIALNFLTSKQKTKKTKKTKALYSLS
jgi:hypothetical protein